MRAVIDSSEKRLSEQRKCNEDGTGGLDFVVLADLNPKPDNPHDLLSYIILRKGCRMEFGRQGTAVLVQVW